MKKQEKLLTGIKNVDLMILSYLNDKDLVSICNTSKRADKICKDENFWRNRILVQYPEVSPDIFKKYKGERKWADYYVHDLVKIKEKNAQDVLDYSAEDGRLDRVIIALSKGANINENDDLALKLASERRQLEVVKYLINHGANIHAEEDEALVSASHSGYLEIVKFLIESGANIHAEEDLPLRFASHEGRFEVVKYLIESGANINAKDGEALRMARKNGHSKVADYLEEQQK